MRLTVIIPAIAIVLAAANSSVQGDAISPLRVVVTPAVALVDQPLAIRVHARAGDTVKLKLTTHRFGMTFESETSFLVPPSGTLDMSRDAPLSGSYSGRHAMGLFWSALPGAGSGHHHGALRRDGDLAPRPYTITATRGTQVAQASGTRLVVAHDARRRVVDAGPLVATLFSPVAGCRPGAIVLGGSEGGVPEEQAAVLAGNGFTTLALAYFAAPGLPKTLENIPVETVQRGFAVLRRSPAVCPSRRIALVGWSKGAELALLFASMFPDAGAVVAVAPSSVVFFGLGDDSGPIASSWSYRGKPLPFAHRDVPQRVNDAIDAQRNARQRVSYRDSYLAQLPQDTDDAAVIPVERIRGPVLLIAGGDDKLWPSDVMAGQVMARLKDRGHRYGDRLLLFPAAGHPLGVPFEFAKATLARSFLDLGGTAAANESADEDSWPRLIAFLRSAA
jgi:dienelactone hydrolase